MVDYAEEADFPSKRRKRKPLNAHEISERRAARAAARDEGEWHRYAKDVCYRQLSMMERSVAQLREALSRHLVPDEIAAETIEHFVQAGLVDDERYAGMFVRSKFAQKATSRRQLRAELQRKGIPAQIAEQALLEITPEDEARVACDFARRAVNSMNSLDRDVIRRRLYGRLARRGFSGQQIRLAMDAALADNAARNGDVDDWDELP